jgi:hypothetical protein
MVAAIEYTAGSRPFSLRNSRNVVGNGTFWTIWLFHSLRIDFHAKELRGNWKT